MPSTIGPFLNVPAPGDPIRSDWAQQVTRYGVNRPYVYFAASTQVPVSPGANVAIPTTGAQNVVDPYAMLSAGGLTVPTGYAGLYLVTAQFSIGSHNGGKQLAAWAGVGATRYGQVAGVPSPTEGQSWTSSAVIAAAAANVIGFAAFHTNPSSLLVGLQHVTVTYLGGTGTAPQ